MARQQGLGSPSSVPLSWHLFALPRTFPTWAHAAVKCRHLQAVGMLMFLDLCWFEAALGPSVAGRGCREGLLCTGSSQP